MVTQFSMDFFNDPFFIGFNRDFDKLSRIHTHATGTNYPPYNVITTDNEDVFFIELAVAGFAKEDLEVSVKDQVLTVKGEIKDSKDEPTYAHRGIATRKFTREFALGEFIEVTGAVAENGMLKISLERIVPEDKKPKSIKIK